MSAVEETDQGGSAGSAGREGHEARSGSEWTDVDQRVWRVGLTPERLVLESGDDLVDLPAARWANDIHVAEHAGGYLVRIETFKISLKFLVSCERAAPLLSALLRSLPTDSAARMSAEEPDERNRPLLWPKVSPLAVWALICSSVAFVPVCGLLPAAATLVLLILHRRQVRRASAWRHSRRLCSVAVVLLLFGLLVSALATWSALQPSRAMTGAGELFHTGSQKGTWGAIAGGLVVVLLALTVHEAAHAITAWWLGDGLARSLGRVTLNPLAHIDPFGTVLLPLLLALAQGPIFGYARPVPVRVELLPRYRRAHILISLAGPGSNMLLGATSLMLLLGLGCAVRLAYPDAVVANLSELNPTVPVSATGFLLAPVFAACCTILKLSFFINVVLAVFNLIPIPPLDGSWVLEHLFPQSLGRLYAVIRPYGFLVFLGAIYLGLFKYLAVPLGFVLVPAFLLLEVATGM